MKAEWQECVTQFQIQLSGEIIVSGPRIVDADTKARMKDLLTEIQSGKFAREWIARKQKWSSKL